MIKNKQRILFFSFLILVFGAVLTVLFLSNPKKEVPVQFEAERAWRHVEAQMEFGPRIPGSVAHQQTLDYIRDELKSSGWKVEIQETEQLGHPIQNIIAKRGGTGRWVVFGAHYDSRFYADQDANLINQKLPVPGANDGASGVAVLLELARVLPKESDRQVWLVFFDAEDQGRIAGWDWILGSRAFVESLTAKPDAVVVVDMIGDKDLNIYREKSSDETLTENIWQTASQLGYETNFINEEKYSILDDHIPFLEAEIPAIDIIDFDYPFWHTASDTSERVSPESLAIIGNTLLSWYENDLMTH